MSCLSLLSFSPSIPSVFRAYDPPPVSNPDEQHPQTPIMTPPRSPEELDSPYDKLSQVSVSHRRVDSFEWVMTQSAPNTPPSLDGSDYNPFLPPPVRHVRSAPLPVPNESWSGPPRSCKAKDKRGYFDWWSSPRLNNDKGYERIPRSEEPTEHDALGLNNAIQKSLERPPQTIIPQAHSSPASHSSPAYCTPLASHDHLRPLEGLNALGILLPDTPPASPQTTESSGLFPPFPPSRVDAEVSKPRVPKRVSFSPVIDEVVLLPWSELDSREQKKISWGGYLPSSFLVAQPPIARSTLPPVIRGKSATRPILRRSTSLHRNAPQDSILVSMNQKNVEMMRISPRQSKKGTPFNAPGLSPIPAQRLPAGDLHTHVRGHKGDDRAKTERAFVLLLQAAQKPATRRLDSKLLVKSRDSDGDNSP